MTAIIRPVCPHCRVEMKWEGDPCNGDIGYYCRTEWCEHEDMSEQEIHDYIVPCKRDEAEGWRHRYCDPEEARFFRSHVRENGGRMVSIGMDRRTVWWLEGGKPADAGWNYVAR
jgi:hypothetical protein